MEMQIFTQKTRDILQMYTGGIKLLIMG